MTIERMVNLYATRNNVTDDQVIFYYIQQDLVETMEIEFVTANNNKI
jgi:hypothetical protein